MIDCEKDWKKMHEEAKKWRELAGMQNREIDNLRGLLQKAEDENDKANNALEQLSQEHAATLKWYNDLRDACTTNGNTYTLKSLIAQTERLDDEIAALKAENEKLRNMDCEISGDICDVVTMIDGAQYRVRIDKDPSCSR